MSSGPLVEVEPTEVRRVPVGAHASHHARKYRHPIRKAWLFARRDGPFETVRKVRSKRAERRVEAAQQILVCAWGDGASRCIGITRDLGGVPRLHPELIFRAPAHLDPAGIQLPGDVLRLLEAYLPVPECPLAPAVATAVRAANPLLDTGGSLGPGRSAPSAGQGPPHRTGRTGRRDAMDRGSVFVLGCGGYVREQILPLFGRDVAAAVDHKAELLRAHWRPGFPVHRDVDAVLPAIARAERPLVIVATYHSNHVHSALAVLDANPGACVFVEKPVATTVADAETLARRRADGAWIDVGFNRRHAALTDRLGMAAARLPRPLVFNALVKELKIPASHWYHWPNQGTRVTGNLCHWIDLAHHLIGARCVGVQALGDDATVSASLRFAEGSVATLSATDAGDDLGGVTEYLELRGRDTTLVVDDFCRLVELEDGRKRTRRRRREKGHRRMYRDLRDGWLEGAPPAYPVQDIVAVARLTAAVVEALETGRPVSLTSDGARP
jgi:predicted dehydrogenase